jgi:hypothetical protein
VKQIIVRIHGENFLVVSIKAGKRVLSCLSLTRKKSLSGRKFPRAFRVLFRVLEAASSSFIVVLGDSSGELFLAQNALFIQFISIRRAKLIKSLFRSSKAEFSLSQKRAPRLGASECEFICPHYGRGRMISSFSSLVPPSNRWGKYVCDYPSYISLHLHRSQSPRLHIF